jgi:hypothetical protein
VFLSKSFPIGATSGTSPFLAVSTVVRPGYHFQSDSGYLYPATGAFAICPLACNLGNLWRRLVLPKRIDAWSQTILQQRLVKTGRRLIKHARYYWLQLAESHLTRRLFVQMLRRIWALPAPSG